VLNIARKIADHIKSYAQVEVVTHLDADGIAAGSIAKKALLREGIDTKITILKQLDDAFLKKIDKSGAELYWFTDLGSGNLELLTDINAVVTDHHEIQSRDVELTRSARTDLMELSRVIEQNKFEMEYHLNPHLFDRDGAYDISGAGVTYLVSKMMRNENIDLSKLAVIGAVGDLQDNSNRKLIGTNRKILDDAVKKYLIEPQIDIRLYGRETRPLHRFLMYATDPELPGLSKNENECIRFLKDLDIPLKADENWRRWVDLNADERKKVLSELTLILINNKRDHKIVERLIGEVYLLPQEEKGTELHDAKEFATLLNSCGRYQSAEIGIEVCLDNRADALASARKLLKGHRSNLIEMLKIVKEIGVSQMDKTQYFIAENRIGENIIGTVTGMVLNSGDVDNLRPLVGFANCDDGLNVKVSARASQHLSEEGLNLSEVVRVAAEQVGGTGGGHNIAAGAQIPYGTEKTFLNILNKLLANQNG
jgi:RecJ-like exonuclease